MEKKILEEQSLKDNAESKINNLEQEEIEVMKRIRTTTQVHKSSNNLCQNPRTKTLWKAWGREKSHILPALFSYKIHDLHIFRNPKINSRDR